MTRLILMCKTFQKTALSIHYICNISVSSADCLTLHLPQDAPLKQNYFHQKVFSWARFSTKDVMESFLESKMNCVHAHMRLPLGSWEGPLVSPSNKKIMCLLPAVGSEKSLGLRK